jgi:phosphatidylserine/phosphatidylglycerophosphate/cardiolipin synthase-like enzyme
MNWTDDSWARQENVVVTVDSPELAALFVAEFEQLWNKDLVEETGTVPPERLSVDGTLVRPWFTPGFGEDLSQRIAKQIGRAQHVRICSPVITAAPILGTLAELVAEGKRDIAGCVDAPQVGGVVYQWGENGNVAWKLPLLRRVMSGDFTGKPSTPWGEGTVHDFMHAKVVVADDVVFVGSFNLSRSGERNAENVLEIHDSAMAASLSAYVDEVRHRYPRLQLPA